MTGTATSKVLKRSGASARPPASAPVQPDIVAEMVARLERYRAGVSLLDLTYVPRNDVTVALATSIRTGLTPKVWAALRGVGFTVAEIASVVGISEKTISRKQSGSEHLDVVEGDRTVRLTQIALEATEAFGAVDKAMRWLRKPNRTLGGDKPIDLIATEPGTTLVRRALGTIEYGGVT